MIDPGRRIKEFSRLLAKGGQLFVEIPNKDPLLHQSWKQCLQHVCFYTVETFKKLIERQSGFDIEVVTTCGAKIDDIMTAGDIVHDFDTLDTPNGWVIRAILKTNVQRGLSLTPV